MTDKKTLFVAHGSSRAQANEHMNNLVFKAFEESVSVCYLEAASPSIPEALSKLAESGTKEVRIIPLFLVPGNHTTRDIPKLVEETAQKYPDTSFKIESFLGSRPEFVELLKSIV